MASEKKNEKFFYTSNQLAKACGISRATVLRLEQRGLIMPHNRENTTSSRAYGIADVYKTCFLNALQRSGFDNALISEFLDNNYDYNILKKELEDKIAHLQFMLSNINEHLDESNHLHTGTTTVGDVLCYAVPVELTSDREENIKLFFPILDQAIRKGYQLMNYPPAIVIPEDFIESVHAQGSFTGLVCIPINRKAVSSSELKKAIAFSNTTPFPTNPGLVDFPGSSLMHVTWFGSTIGFAKAFKELDKQIEKAGKTGYGNYHILLLKGEFFDENTPESFNCIRVLRKVK